MFLLPVIFPIQVVIFLYGEVKRIFTNTNTHAIASKMENNVQTISEKSKKLQTKVDIKLKM